MVAKKLMAILSMVLLSQLTGCAATKNSFVSVKNYTRGELYLLDENYSDCITKFNAEVETNATDANAHFYLGRCSLAVENNQSALASMQKAVTLNPDNPDYYFWQGVAYAANGQAKRERQSYEKALALKPNHLQSLVYLGHNHFEAGRYLDALAYYDRALEENPDIAPALYNRALTLRWLQRTPEEINAWVIYLDRYPDGAFARQAVTYLNRYGRFDYRNHIIGKRTLTLAQVRFMPSSDRLKNDSHLSLKSLAHVIKMNQKATLHILAYQKNNGRLGELRAKSIKKFLLSQERNLNPARIKVSWFDQPESVKIGKRVHRLDSSINFFAQSG
jgi:tetratricopeptide (TPR) repeat protein